MIKRIVIFGGTGYIGRPLVEALKQRYSVLIITRDASRHRPSDHVSYWEWDGRESLSAQLEDSLAVINLAGENIGNKRWSHSQRDIIKKSRTSVAEAIKYGVEHCQKAPSVWIQASAVGYYGQQGRSGHYATEESPKSTSSDFLSDVCQAWEQPIQDCSSSIRKIIIRSGVVLSPESLVWKQSFMPFKARIAVIPGSGKNYLPWIALDDEIRAIQYLLESESLKGIFNLVAPQSLQMRELIALFKKQRQTFITVHIPRVLLNIVFGKEMVHELILTNQLISPQALLDSGFLFKFEESSKLIKHYLKDER